MSTPTPVGGASLSDLLTAAKNIVVAINNLAQTYLNVNGTLNAPAVASTTVIKAAAGRVASVSVIIAGTSIGTVYDGASVTATTKPLATIPNTVGVYTIDMPASFGILINPGLGQSVTVSYS